MHRGANPAIPPDGAGCFYRILEVGVLRSNRELWELVRGYPKENR
tara:strand:+ start:414 stop:548 length:135 start_codon:yes stop_codon:yes gene_type:complete